ncbi:MAG: transcriptional regulator [Caldilineaceae bacterium]|nr:transcriptional regulator [Caldilineaceae bacterium]
MDATKFSKMAESLRQYRRAELRDFTLDIGNNPVDSLYVDPLPGDAVLETVLSSNTTFLLGRKGTGKSTIFSRAQSEIRKQNTNISVYIDVKALYDVISTPEISNVKTEDIKVSQDVLQSHLLRKSFLGAVLAEMITEINKFCGNMSFIERLSGKKRKQENALSKLDKLKTQVKNGLLHDTEIPILQRIEVNKKNREQHTVSSERSGGISGGGGTDSFSIDAQAASSSLDEALNDSEIYLKYSEVVMRSLPYDEIIRQVGDLLAVLNMGRLVIFFDDFSEISWANQRLFVDAILSPLNNSSNEKIKLKVAGYPGRVYYGKIDPGKIDTVRLDFYDLYKSTDVQSMEHAAVEYTSRLLTHRFGAFGLHMEEYFDPANSIDDYMRLIFEATFNVPRLVGFLLHYCYRDRIARGQRINVSAIRLASRKYYEDVLEPYFERRNQFAIEPFDRKLDRHNQNELLKTIIGEVRDVRRRISSGEVGGAYFKDLKNPPASHFSVAPTLEKLLASLEFNFLITKYHDMRDKSGKDVSIYALFYGICESERIPWGYPTGRRDDRSYFVQRCFSYNTTIQQFLAKSQTIRCHECGASFPMDRRESFELYKWKCPECQDGSCKIVNLADEYLSEISRLDKEIMLPEVELDILETLHTEVRAMRAGEISQLIDVTYQLVGHRTSKLQDMNLVDKRQDGAHMRSSITQRAIELYFES